MITSLSRLRLTGLMVTLLAFLSSGCTHLEGGARIENVTSAHDSFSGLLPAQDDAKPESSTKYIFVIHGMGNTLNNYDDKLLNAIESRGWTRVSRGQYIDMPLQSAYNVKGEGLKCMQGEPPCTYRSFGKFKVDRFQKNSPLEAKVVVYTYFWNDSLDKLQSNYLKTDLDSNTGAIINTLLKRDLIDYGFSDATAYLGDAGKLVRKGIEGTLCNMLYDAAGVNKNGSSCQLSQIEQSDIVKSKDVQFSFLSFSLGSRMLYDVLSGMPGDGPPSPAISHFAARTNNFFMAANQMPLIGLGRVSVTDDSTIGNVPKRDIDAGLRSECVGGFFGVVSCVRSKQSQIPSMKWLSDVGNVLPGDLEVIAFHDPADLLGYRASGGIADSSGTKFIEVNHRNTPVVLGLLAWPSFAHATELEHEDSLDLILCGGTADHEGHLKAKICR